MSKIKKVKSTSTDESFLTPRWVNVMFLLIGDPPGRGSWRLLALFHDVVVLDTTWESGVQFTSNKSKDDQVSISIAMPHINLADAKYQELVASKPLIFILRSTVGKAGPSQDPLLHLCNHYGGNVDLFPLVLGETEVNVLVKLCSIESGKDIDCSIQVQATAGELVEPFTLTPLMVTMVSAHCLPQAKDGTFYMSALGLNDVCDPPAVNLGLSLSSRDATKIVWATASNAGHAANTKYNVHKGGTFIHQDMTGWHKDGENCRHFYWNSMTRVLVDPNALKERLASPLMVEIAGLPKLGRQDVRGRYVAYVDARVLLEPGIESVTTAANLRYFVEKELPENMRPLLVLPPMSAKALSARESLIVQDEYEHNAYVAIRFDLMEALVAEDKPDTLLEIIGFMPSQKSPTISNKLDVVVLDDQFVDARKIRNEGGALAVHKELCNLSLETPLNQGLKRTAANKLLMRVRTMLNGFPPENCSYLEWQDTVTGQHAASRRAVMASFAPQPPAAQLPHLYSATRCRMVGDIRLADLHVKNSLEVAPGQPRPLMIKTLRCLEERNDIDAKNYLLQALRLNPRNRYLLWIFGGQEFDKEQDSAKAALRLATKGLDHSDGTSTAVAWAALHSFFHYNDNNHAAYVMLRKTRKAYTLTVQWTKMLEQWTHTSGEEEIFWIPSVISTENPFVCASAFFLCLRCYKFSERLLQCAETRSATHASLDIPDLFYLRAASLLLRRQYDLAMKMTIKGVNRHGPCAILSQMKLSCLVSAHGWNEECETALEEAEKAGSVLPPALLYRAAFSLFKNRPTVALQRVARAHMVAPCGHSALLIGRIFDLLHEDGLAERWVASAVRLEPLLSDGWAVLALLAHNHGDRYKGKHMLRTARQVGPISADLEQDISHVPEFTNIYQSPSLIAKDICFCDYITTDTEFKK